MKENRTGQVKPVWREADAQCSMKQWDSLAALWVVTWCCMGAPGIYSVHSWLRSISPGSSCGEGGRGRCGFDLCLCVLVCERPRERTRDSEGFVWSVDARGNVLYCGSFPQDVKHLCWSREVMCEVHSTRSTVAKVWCGTPMWDLYGDVGGYWVVLLFRDPCLNAW